jgi:hypothetical protein
VAAQPIQYVVVTVTNNNGPDLAPAFLGLSYESSMLLPKEGRYYFDADDKALVNTFKTLGIKSLRVGASAVDDPRIPIPQEKDIDALFRFARAAGIKVIYSFRLKNGDSADSARLASYIESHFGGLLDSFSIGNEPEEYLKEYPDFYAAWKLHYDAILKAVPNAMIEGPSSNRSLYALDLARDLFARGHLSMVTTHYYIFGSGRNAEKDPAATRARFLTNANEMTYGRAYAGAGGVLASQGVPYRIDEMNNCYNGGARDASDTYASTLWALDWNHWWAAHHILGLNFHTGELVGRDGQFAPPNYAAFLRKANGKGFEMRPEAYAFLAFTQGARGQPEDVKIEGAPEMDFNAYAYRAPDGSSIVTLINKSYGDHARTASVSIQLPPGTGSGVGAWRRLDLVQKGQDVSAKTGVTLGSASLDTQGNWSGHWERLPGGNSNQISVQVRAASATILEFTPQM